MSSKFDLTDGMAIRPEQLGTEMLLAPAPHTISAARVTMDASQTPQAVVLNNGELPQWFTGYEEIFGRYTFGTAGIKEKGTIVAVIPKFHKWAPQNPSLLVIYTGWESGEINCFTVENHVALSSSVGFGYRTKPINTHCLFPGHVVEPNMEFTQPCNHDDNLYGIGIDVPVAFISLRSTVEDANGISESLAKRLQFNRIFRYTVDIPSREIPLNLYGDNVSYECIPELGATVNPQGILLATRPIAKGGFADLTDTSLHQVKPGQDRTFRVFTQPPPVVVDLDVYLGQNVKRDNLDDPHFEQVRQIYDQHIYFYNQVVDHYYTLTGKGHTCSNRFNDLVTTALGYLAVAIKRHGLRTKLSQGTYQVLNRCTNRGRGSREFGLYDATTEQPVDFIRMVITVRQACEGTRGSKTTGRDGCKGVTSVVIPDEDMPVDDHGIRAHMVLCPRAIPNRLVTQPLYEQFFNRAAEMVRRRVIAIPETQWADRVKVVLDFITILDPTWAKLVAQTIGRQEAAKNYLETIVEDKLHYRIPPISKRPLLDLVEAIAAAYPEVEATPVTYYIRQPDGTRRRCRTKVPVMIGNKYIKLLFRIPGSQLSATSGAFINQHCQPVRPDDNTRHAAPLKQTPQRFGEDETHLIGAALGWDNAARHLALMGGSWPGAQAVANTMLTTECPSNVTDIDISTKELLETSSAINLVNHALGVLGVKLVSDQEPRNN